MNSERNQLKPDFVKSIRATTLSV